MKICVVCNQSYQPTTKAQKNCPDCRNLAKCEKHQNLYKRSLKCIHCAIEESHVKYTESNQYEWIECPECAYRANDICLHAIYIHKMSPDDFKIKHNLKVLKSQKLCDKVKGDKNPGYNHGGKYSVFSDNFVKKVDGCKERAVEKARKSMVENGNLKTTMSYWLKQTNGDAVEAVRLKDEYFKDNVVFSLENCIKRYGHEKGLEVWKKRQKNWLASLRSKSKEEIDEINRKKSNQMSFGNLWTNRNVKDGIFYILDIGNGLIKFGITGNSIEHRYKPYNTEYSIIKQYDTNISNCFQVERLVKDALVEYAIKKDEEIFPFGWTETIRKEGLNVLLEFCEERFNDLEGTTKLFKETFNLKYPENF